LQKGGENEQLLGVENGQSPCGGGKKARERKNVLAVGVEKGGIIVSSKAKGLEGCRTERKKGKTREEDGIKTRKKGVQTTKSVTEGQEETFKRKKGQKEGKDASEQSKRLGKTEFHLRLPKRGNLKRNRRNQSKEPRSAEKRAKKQNRTRRKGQTTTGGSTG